MIRTFLDSYRLASPTLKNDRSYELVRNSLRLCFLERRRIVDLMLLFELICGKINRSYIPNRYYDSMFLLRLSAPLRLSLKVTSELTCFAPICSTERAYAALKYVNSVVSFPDLSNP